MNISEANYRILLSVTSDNSITTTSSPSYSAKPVTQVEARKNYVAHNPRGTASAEPLLRVHNEAILLSRRSVGQLRNKIQKR